ncbi:MAG TPA: hypothetical protein GX699_01915 [Firmicutes bacterium]|nr:hypothetical protein [Bacillota bacterium]
MSESARNKFAARKGERNVKSLPGAGKTLFMLVLTVCCLLLPGAGAHAAAVTSVVTRDSQNIDYLYNYEDVLISYTRKVVGQQALLFDDYKNKTVVAVSSEKSGYIDYEDVLTAYTKAVVQKIPFDLVQYIESGTAKKYAFSPVTRTVREENGQLLFSAWQPPGSSTPLTEINAITDNGAMRLALEKHAQQLGLNLAGYNQLNNYGKTQAAAAVIIGRPPGGYPDTAALQTVFTAVVDTCLSLQAEALAAVNAAATPQDMRTAISAKAMLLEFNLSGFEYLTLDKQEIFLQIMVNSRPFATVAAARTAFINALQTVGVEKIITYEDYDHTFSDAVTLQMGRNPQTDLLDGTWKTADRNLVEWFLNVANFVEEMRPAAIVRFDGVRMRTGPGTDFAVIRSFNTGEGPYFIINQAEDSEGYTWYRLLTEYRVGWIRADLLELTEKKGDGLYQFLVLSGTTNVIPAEVNEKILKGKGILEGKADAFVTAAQQYNINEIFLISLALHETHNGTSQLATGVEYKGQIVYNMYGIGAVDQDPINKGAEYAYNHGWFTPEAAIIGGAEFAATSYIHHPLYKQDTLYKMRWNPANPGAHQYATDIGWAAKQVIKIKELYELCSSYILRFAIPRYR